MELPVHSIWKKPLRNPPGLQFFFWVKRDDLKWTVLVVSLWFQEAFNTAFPGSKRRAGGRHWGTCLSAQPFGITWDLIGEILWQQLWIALWFMAQYCIELSTLSKAENSSVASSALEGLQIHPSPKLLLSLLVLTTPVKFHLTKLPCLTW